MCNRVVCPITRSPKLTLIPNHLFPPDRYAVDRCATRLHPRSYVERHDGGRGRPGKMRLLPSYVIIVSRSCRRTVTRLLTTKYNCDSLNDNRIDVLSRRRVSLRYLRFTLNRKSLPIGSIPIGIRLSARDGGINLRINILSLGRRMRYGATLGRGVVK